MNKANLISMTALCLLVGFNTQAGTDTNEPSIEKKIIVLNDQVNTIGLKTGQLLASNDLDQDMEELNEDILDMNEEMSDMGLELQELVKTLRSLGDTKANHGAFLGILLDPDKGAGKGVYLIGVTPNGPAQHAGLQADDLLLELNGKSLEEDAEHGSAVKLRQVMQDVKPGDKVIMLIKRNGQQHQVELVTGKMSEHLQYGLKFLADDLELRLHKKGSHMGMHDEAFSDIELYPMNEQLGSYFDTAEGMLILNVPKKNQLGFMVGDVILRIGGRTPNSPSQVWRILQSYDSGETIEFTLMRQKKETLLQVKKP